MFELPTTVASPINETTRYEVRCYTVSHNNQSGITTITAYSNKVYNNNSQFSYQTFALINSKYVATSPYGTASSTLPANCYSPSSFNGVYIPPAYYDSIFIACSILLAVLCVGLFKVFKR